MQYIVIIRAKEAWTLVKPISIGDQLSISQLQLRAAQRITDFIFDQSPYGGFFVMGAGWCLLIGVVL